MLKIPESIFDIHDRRRVEYPDDPPAPMPDLSTVLDLSKHLVLVPVHRFVDQDTNFCLWGLHDLGVKVKFSKGASAIDATPWRRPLSRTSWTRSCSSTPTWSSAPSSRSNCSSPTRR